MKSQKLAQSDKRKILKDFKEWTGGYTPKNTLYEWEDNQDKIDNIPSIVNYIEYVVPKLAIKLKKDKNIISDFIRKEALI